MSQIRGHNSPLMKARNRSAVLRLLLQRGPMARRDLAALLDLTPATITNVARELIGHGLIEERPDLEVQSAAVTRKPVPIAVRAGGAFAIGINLGITRANVGLLDLAGTYLGGESLRYPASGDPSAIIAQLAAAVDRALTTSNIDPRRVIGVGLGVAGVVDPGRGLVRSHLTLGWRDVTLGPALADALGRPVRVVNNVHGMAINEQLYGAAAHAETFAVVYAGSIVGAGVVIDGRLLQGRDSAAGLIGHIPVAPDGPPCVCGGQGCLDVVAGDVALLQAAREAIAAGRRTAIADLLELTPPDDPRVSVFEPIYRAARAGDRLAVDLLRQQARYLGQAIASLLYLIDPELVVVVTSVPTAEIDLDGQSFVDLIRETARTRAYLLDDVDARIRLSRFGEDAGVRGAAVAVIADYLDAAPFADRPTAAGTPRVPLQVSSAN